MGEPRYLIIAPQGLGDALEATPLIRSLRDASPRATIDVIALRPTSRDLFEGLRPMVDDVLYLPFWEHGTFAFLRAVFQKRWRKTYDVTFLCYPAARKEYHLLSRMFPSRNRVAHRYSEPSANNFLWMHDKLVDVSAQHNVVRNLDMLKAQGIRYERPEGYTIPVAWKNDAGDRERPRLAIHCGTIKHNGLESRRWPLPYFEAVARAFAKDCDLWIVMGPAERDESLDIQRNVPEAQLFEGPIDALSRFLSGCDAVLCNDNGVAHLATATGVPVVSLFGPTALENSPYGKNSFPLRPTECPPCFDVRDLNHSCRLQIDYRCLKKDLPVKLVVERIRSILASSKSAVASGQETSA